MDEGKGDPGCGEVHGALHDGDDRDDGVALLAVAVLLGDGLENERAHIPVEEAERHGAILSWPACGETNAECPHHEVNRIFKYADGKNMPNDKVSRVRA